MVSKSRRILGLTQSDQFGEKEILKNFRMKVKSDPDRVMELGEAGLDLMKLYRKDMIGLKLLDEVFNDMIEGSIFSADDQTVQLFMRGFKPIAHKGVFAILKKKFGKIIGCSFERNNCEVVLDCLTLPNDRSGSAHKFPPVKIKVNSTINNLIFEFGGESACLFVLFHLKSIIQTFLKQLPEKIEKCYKSPKADRKSHLPRKHDTSGSESSKSQGTKSSSEDEKSPSPILKSTRGPRRAPHAPSTSPPSDHAAPPGKSPVSSQDTVIIEDEDTVIIEDEDQKQVDCVVCALKKLNLKQIAEVNVIIDLKCSKECLQSGESLENFVSQLCEIICTMNLPDFDSMPIFRENLKNIIEKIIDKMTLGAPGFYCAMLRLFSDFAPHDKDRLAIISREVLELCLTDEFGNVLKEDREARRNLFHYIRKTGSYFAFQSIVESFHKMFRRKVDLMTILPQDLRYIIEMFKDVPAFKDDFLAYHDFIGEISRSIITKVLANEFIDFSEISKKEFKNGDECLEIVDDNFIYVDKLNSQLYHFLYLGGSVFAEPIAFKNLVFNEELKLVSSPKWNFYLENETIIQNLKIIKGKVESEGSTNINEVNLSENASDQYSSSDSDSEAGNKGVQVVNARFTILKDDVMKYWDGRPNVRRKFLAGECGSVWPKMYNSPCVVVMGYNYVKLPGSQKRMSNFAKLKGKCKLCEATHNFEISESPFQETIREAIHKKKKNQSWNCFNSSLSPHPSPKKLEMLTKF